MSQAPQSRMELLITSINSKNLEIRERAISNILSKIELGLIPSSTIITHYHNIIGECLINLNNYQTNTKERFIIKIIKILNSFLKNDEGKNILKEYGCIEFFSEFLKYRVKNFSELRKILENFLENLITKKKILKFEKKIKILEKIEKYENFNYRELLQNLVNNCENLFNDNFCYEILLSENDRSFLINLITKIKFCDIKNLNFENEIFENLMKILNDFPIEIFFLQFSELFYDILNIITENENYVISYLLFSSLLKNISKNLFFKKISKFEKIERKEIFEEKINFLEKSYPDLKKNKKSINLKLSIDNIIEIIIRLFSIFIIKKNDFLIKNELFEFLDNLYKNSKINKKKLNLLIKNSLNFFCDKFIMKNNLNLKFDEIHFFRFNNNIFEFLLFLENSKIDYDFSNEKIFSFLIENIYKGFLNEKNIFIFLKILEKKNLKFFLELENYCKMKNNISDLKNKNFENFKKIYKNEKILIKDITKKVEFVENKIFGFLKIENKENLKIMIENLILIFFLEKENSSYIYEKKKLFQNYKKKFLEFLEISLLDENYKNWKKGNKFKK